MDLNKSVTANIPVLPENAVMVEVEGREGAYASPDFGRIDGAAGHNYLPTQMFRPSAIPDEC